MSTNWINCYIDSIHVDMKRRAQVYYMHVREDVKPCPERPTQLNSAGWVESDWALRTPCQVTTQLNSTEQSELHLWPSFRLATWCQHQHQYHSLNYWRNVWRVQKLYMEIELLEEETLQSCCGYGYSWIYPCVDIRLRTCRGCIHGCV